MLIVVTGATGHVGANMVRGLLEQGFSVRAVYHSESKLTALKGLPLETVKADVLDPSSLAHAFAGAHAVVNLAAIISIGGDPKGLVMTTNTQGPRNVVAACLQAGVGKLIHFSSIHAFHYTAKDPVVNESSPPADADPRAFAYSRSKAIGEREVLKGLDQGLDVNVFNPTSVIGPHDYFGSLSGDMLRKLFRGALPALIRGGFDWVDARDLVPPVIEVLNHSRPGERYLLSGRWASFRELAGIAHAVSGVKPPLLTLPVWAAMAGLPFLQLHSRLTSRQALYTWESLRIIQDSNLNCSHEKAARELGYQPRALEETVRDIFEWDKGLGVG